MSSHRASRLSLVIAAAMFAISLAAALGAPAGPADRSIFIGSSRN